VTTDRPRPEKLLKPGSIAYGSASLPTADSGDRLLGCANALPFKAAPMPKLLFVSKYIDHILYFFLDQLSRKTELTIVVDQKNQWTERLTVDSIELIHLAPRSKFDRQYKKALESLKGDRDWDLIQCFHGNSELANVIRWNRGRLPLVAYRARIGHLKFRENPTAYWNARNPTLAAVAAVSSEVKKYLESFSFFEANNVRVIGHGINRQWVESQTKAGYGLRGKLGIDDDALIVVSIAALRPVKRFNYIVEAAEALRDLPIHFVHVGAPKGWDEIAVHVPKVHFLGPQDEPFPILAESDVFAMTSHNEAFGRANLEAMACGKPVIGSNTGGLLDLVVPGVTGQLFETNDPGDFTNIVKNYCNDRTSIIEHGRNAIDRVDRYFTTEKMTEKYFRLYEDVLAAARQATR
jgi:glycosyltransferase involved in cell wall biosynthesis